MAKTPSETMFSPDGTALRQTDPEALPGPYTGPENDYEASVAWLAEAEAMRAAAGGFVTHDQAIAYSIAYGIQSLLTMASAG